MIDPAVIAWLPATPMLVPDITGEPDVTVATLRSAADDAVKRAARDDPPVIAVVAPTDAPHTGETGAWSWHGFGVGYRPPADTLPWQIGLGAWLLDRAGWHGPRCYVGVAADGESATPASRALALAVANGGNLLVLGDGCAGLDEGSAPDLIHDARVWDEQVASTVGSGDAAALAAIDTAGTGRTASAATTYPLVARLLTKVNRRAETLYRGAPFGIDYLVATWSI